MMGIAFPAKPVRRHHEGMLLVRLHSGAFSGPSPVHDLLAKCEREGTLRRHLPVNAPPAGGARRPLRRAADTMAAVAAAPRRGHPHDGALVLEVRSERLRDSLLALLLADHRVATAERIPTRYLHVSAKRTLSGILPPVRLWNVEKIRWPEARAVKGFQHASRLKVAVLDSGVDARHPALRGRVRRYVHAYPDLTAAISDVDHVGHGTHIAGTIGGAATAAHTLGGHGLTRALLYVWKIFRDDPPLDVASHAFAYLVDPPLLYRALDGCFAQRVDVVNMSFGGPEPPDTVEGAHYERLAARGTMLVGTMGNARSSGSPTMYPAALPEVIAVGATGVDDVVAPFSSRGTHIALCAPGVGIWSALPTYAGQVAFLATGGKDGKTVRGAPVTRNRQFDAWPGTSVAAPHVTAAVALVIANRGRPSGVAEMRDLLMRTACRVPMMGRQDFTLDYGAGRLDLYRLLTANR